jgi:hypothetical protein
LGKQYSRIIGQALQAHPALRFKGEFKVLLHWFGTPMNTPPESQRSDESNQVPPQPPTSSDRAPPVLPKPKSVAPTPPTPKQQQHPQLGPPKYTRDSYHAADLSESDVSYRGPDSMYPVRQLRTTRSPTSSSHSSPDGRAPPTPFRQSAASAAPVAAAPPLSTYEEPTAPQPQQPHQQPQPPQQPHQQPQPPQQPRQQPQQSRPKPAPAPVSEQQPQSDGNAPVPKWAGSGFRIKKAPVALPPQRSSERSAPAPGPPSGESELTQRLRAAIDQDQQRGAGRDESQQQRSSVPPASPRLAKASQSIKTVGGPRDVTVARCRALQQPSASLWTWA